MLGARGYRVSAATPAERPRRSPRRGCVRRASAGSRIRGDPPSSRTGTAVQLCPRSAGRAETSSNTSSSRPVAGRDCHAWLPRGPLGSPRTPRSRRRRATTLAAAARAELLELVEAAAQRTVVVGALQAPGPASYGQPLCCPQLRRASPVTRRLEGIRLGGGAGTSSSTPAHHHHNASSTTIHDDSRSRARSNATCVSSRTAAGRPSSQAASALAAATSTPIRCTSPLCSTSASASSSSGPWAADRRDVPA